MNEVPMSAHKRFKEFFCVIFGHNWNEYGSTSSPNGRILEEYNVCSSCGLENHDRSGYLVEYEEMTRSPKP